MKLNRTKEEIIKFLDANDTVDYTITEIKDNYFDDGISQIKRLVADYEYHEVVRKGNLFDSSMSSAEIKIFNSDNNYIARAVFYEMFQEYTKVRIEPVQK